MCSMHVRQGDEATVVAQVSPHNKDESVTPTRPGQVISVDQMKSPTPGFIAQMTGILTTRRYEYATVYVDQYSSIGFVYLQKTASAKETLLGKMAFEHYCAQHGVKVEHYHADNGIFCAHKWVLDCRAKRQGLTFAGVSECSSSKWPCRGTHSTITRNGMNDVDPCQEQMAPRYFS
jgi:hypothetical protein